MALNTHTHRQRHQHWTHVIFADAVCCPLLDVIVSTAAASALTLSTSCSIPMPPCIHLLPAPPFNSFGAEDLFKAAEEGSAERSRKMLEEDLDAILERAEVVVQQQQPGQQSVAGGASDLLSSFNVATFKVCVCVFAIRQMGLPAVPDRGSGGSPGSGHLFSLQFFGVLSAP